MAEHDFIHLGDGNYEEIHTFSEEETLDAYERSLDLKLERQWREAGLRVKLSLLFLRFAQWRKRKARRG